MQKTSPKRKKQPAQHQEIQPGKEAKMFPLPEFINPLYKACGKLQGKCAIITGGDSGIGRAVAFIFAREGCDVAIVYLNEHRDAEVTKRTIENTGQRCITIQADIKKEPECRRAVEQTVKELGKINIIVNNAAVQYPQDNVSEITSKQLYKTFETNIFSYFYFAKHSLKHLCEGSVIINTASVTAYRGSDHLIDYSSTKGAIISFTRSLSQSLGKRKIRVNAVAPGPVWTPLIPASFSEDHVESYGSDVSMGRAAQPFEIAPCYVFLASDDSVYITG